MSFPVSFPASLPSGGAGDEPRPAPARPETIVSGTTYRFTVLTDRLIRMEHSATGAFVDAATQLVVSRDLGTAPDFEVRRGEDRVEILTEHLHLTHIPSRGFSRSGLSVSVRSKVLNLHGGTWRHGEVWDPEEAFPSNLGGTCRTLDEVDGRARLSPGLLSVSGPAVLDDSGSLLMTRDGWVVPRPGTDPADGSHPDQDLYIFGHGQDYHGALRDFFALSGPTPLIPRTLLGNWWSRYHPYSAEEYLAVMDRFEAEGLPLSVAVIDMDWHLVDIDPAIGNGWTGYTWNRDLFPDSRAFLEALHDRGMEVTLNLHPAMGVRRHEDAYEPMARALGMDPAEGADIPFNIADRAFTAAYLEHAHHPLEDEGVDFWWLDWQQGGTTDVPGLDPLWMLNHVHYLDSGRERTRTLPDGSVETYRRRPVTFSRFADASSHRTPVGFSGDTITTWASLRFQPEFTATAANIGYFWWSNDIGGHMFGERDDQMAARWVQLGCFSPINRLHSTASVFNSKEPWRYSRDARATMEAHLRLRHALVPYLYTWARRAATQGLGPVRPVYHDHPWDPGAYEYRRTFLFGDLLVVPMVDPTDPVSGLTTDKAWLPEGAWFDLATGRRYEAGPGGRTLTLSRPLDRLPVLARAGSIVPLAGDLSEPAGANPHHLRLVVVPGADGEMILEEDDASPDPGPEGVVRTRLSQSWSQERELRLRLEQTGGQGVVPERRRVTVEVIAVQDAGVDGPRAELTGAGCAPGPVEVGAREPTTTLAGGLSIELGEVDAARGVELHVEGLEAAPATMRTCLFEILERAQMPYAVKDRCWGAVERGLNGAELLAEMRALGCPEPVLAAATEVV
ncbi:MAG: glycoside hydrolase family 31 protein [Actinomyces sp.]|uniref:TIM-barrel domain-containing protein n=1 Tax=Actinomyces sp. TaxID=29317 RepID=UPI0026DDB37A|nr:TIM-barrel domain-containing protein [Actinomyces sp.]MDO4242351.1 glycoside hydrolase family 31 protein [Actinomyces sp.]